MSCKKCNKEKTWNGSNMDCPFNTGEHFTKDNWNCGLINKIRTICDAAMEGKGDGALHYQYCEDQKYVAIDTSRITWDVMEEGMPDLGLCLWVSWYKSRGTTDAMWLLDHYCQPKQPTFDQLEYIANWYYKKLNLKD